MKLVREHIDEKFTEKSDPIEDLEIGIFQPRIFTNIDDGAEFMLKALPAILKKDKIPEDILKPRIQEIDPHYSFNPEYFAPILKYVKKYISTKPIDSLWVRSAILSALVLQLRNMGYPKKIYEKFEDESDPIKDMGIGAISFGKKWKALKKKYKGDENLLWKNWKEYLHSFVGKTIEGKVYGHITGNLYGPNHKKFKIKSYETFDITEGNITFWSIDGYSYRINKDELYRIS